jgi:hypothetical protein
MKNIEAKRQELKKVQSLINKMTKNTKSDILKMSEVGRKMMLNTLNEYQAKKISLLSEILA